MDKETRKLINALKAENATLKAENKKYRKLLGEGKESFKSPVTIGHKSHVPPPPPPAPPKRVEVIVKTETSPCITK